MNSEISVDEMILDTRQEDKGGLFIPIESRSFAFFD